MISSLKKCQYSWHSCIKLMNKCCSASYIPLNSFVASQLKRIHSHESELLTVKRGNISQNRYYTNRNILSLHERGLWKDRFPDSCAVLEKKLMEGKAQTVYAGFDPTAESLHIGNLLVLMALLHCQRAGHTPIVLLGGFTGTVGDPSGRKGARPDLPEDTAKHNASSIQSIVHNIFGNHQRLFWKDKDDKPLPRAIFLNNNEWLSALPLSSYFNILGNISGSSLLRSSFIRERLKQRSNDNFSAKEMNYQVLQAYDWLHLYDKYNCSIQIGGSDQMANMWMGHDLVRDMRGEPVTGLTVPLLTDASGQKLGKSTGNVIWLCKNNTSYFDFYQFFLRRKDAEVENLLKLFTFLHMADIKQLMKRHWEKPESLLAQKKLAESLTLLVHGEYGLSVAQNSTSILYHNNSAALLDLTGSQLEDMFNGNVTKLSLQPGTTVVEAAMKAKCFTSQRDCEGTIRGGGFHINQSRVQEPHLALVPDAHVLPSGYSLFRVGKKNYTLVHWTQ